MELHIRTSLQRCLWHILRLMCMFCNIHMFSPWTSVYCVRYDSNVGSFLSFSLSLSLYFPSSLSLSFSLMIGIIL